MNDDQETPVPGAGTGRNPDPQGGRVHTISTKVNLAEGDALAEARERMEEDLRRRGLLKPEQKLKDATFIRLRLLNGGEALKVKYPPAKVDRRRERRGSVPRRVPAADSVASAA